MSAAIILRTLSMTIFLVEQRCAVPGLRIETWGTQICVAVPMGPLKRLCGCVRGWF
jgi:hypothetical protein